jgi:hypothetical protein
MADQRAVYWGHWSAGLKVARLVLLPVVERAELLVLQWVEQLVVLLAS